MTASFPIDDTLPAAVQGIDDKGRPTDLGGPPSWSASDTTIVTVTPSSDGLSASLLGLKAGSFVLTVSAPRFAGDVSPLSATASVTVTPGQAVSLVLSFGTPVAPPVAPPA